MATLSWNWLSDLETWALQGSSMGSPSVIYDGADGDPANGCMEVEGISSVFMGTEYVDSEIDFGGEGDGYVVGALGSQIQLNVKMTSLLSGYVYLYANLRTAGWVNLGYIYRIANPTPGKPDGTWRTYYESIGAVYAGDILDGFRIRLQHGSLTATGTHTIHIDTMSIDNLTAEPSGYTVFFDPTLVTGTGIPSLSMDIAPDGKVILGLWNVSSHPIVLVGSGLPGCAWSTVYNPGAGTCVHVLAGRKDSEKFWICGDFGTPKVRVTEDSGANWSTVDPAWASVTAVYPMHLWAENDDSLTVMTGDQLQVKETRDMGASWTERNGALPFVVSAFDLLDVYPQEGIFGRIVANADRVRATIDNWATTVDISTGTPNAAVTKVIVG